MVQLDQEITANTVQKQLPVRCLTADPGCVVTNIFNEGLGGLEYLYWTLWSIAFYLVSAVHLFSAVADGQSHRSVGC